MYKKLADKEKQSVDAEVKKNAGLQLKTWCKLRDQAAAQPPSLFSATVLKFEIENEGITQGKPSVKFDIVTELETLTVSTKMDRGFRLSLMHQMQWMRFAEVQLVFPTEYALSLWNQQEQDTSEEAKLYGGPDRALQLFMKVEQYIDGRNSVSLSYCDLKP
jgi:hypothetical protein